MSHSSTKLNLARVAGMLRYARPYRAQWALILLLTLLTNAAALLAPWPMKILVDNALGSIAPPAWLVWMSGVGGSGRMASFMLIGVVVGAGLALFAINSLLDALLTCSWVRVGQRMMYDLAQDLFAQIQRRSLVFHTKNTVGDLLARVTGDSWGIYSLVDTLLLAPGRAIIMTIMMILVMLPIDWKLTLVALAVAPLIAGASFWLAPPIRLASRLRREVESRLLSHVQQTLSGIPVVQAFAAEQREQQRFRDFAQAAIGAQKRTTFAGQFHRLGTGFIATLSSGLVLWLGISHVLDGTITLGSVLVFMAYLKILQDQMGALINGWASVQTVSANVDRIHEILDEPVEVVESPNAVPVSRARGTIRFENVSFSYEPSQPVLCEIDLDIPAGSTLAVVGASGAGKSTLAGLVPRLLDPTGGRITLDGRDLKDLKLRDLRKQVAMVLQEAFLFPASIADNIAYARPGATRQEIEAAARAAGADPFVRRLPQGYDTQLGERGSSLSGGERQRIAIARALLKDAPILILDEPTASLDAATEADLLDALKLLMRDRTTLVIAHRLSTVRDADRIVVLENGTIAESGTHDELIAHGGLYADLHEKQTGRRRAALVTES